MGMTVSDLIVRPTRTRILLMANPRNPPRVAPGQAEQALGIRKCTPTIVFNLLPHSIIGNCYHQGYYRQNTLFIN
jgi:hypothetical protein